MIGFSSCLLLILTLLFRTHQRHYIVVSYEGDLPIIAKAAEGQQLVVICYLKWSSSNMGGQPAYHNECFNNDKFSAESNAGPNVAAMNKPH